jgi:DNA-binding PadR family transcriptional regulator
MTAHIESQIIDILKNEDLYIISIMEQLEDKGLNVEYKKVYSTLEQMTKKGILNKRHAMTDSISQAPLYILKC